MGFAGTMGADYIQYLIGDDMTIPSELAHGYTEKIVRMPHTYFINSHKQCSAHVLDLSTCPTRTTFGIPEDKFIFGNFNQTYKIDPKTFDVWMSILKRVPNSVLWLLRFPALSEPNILAEVEARGVRKNRIIFTDVAPKEDHLRRCYLLDLFLDTPACNAHTTGCDALWGGTPIVSLLGERMASRVSASLSKAIGVPEMVTTTLEEYEELAVALALDLDRLWAIRNKISEGRFNKPLFDTKRQTKNLEEGFRLMWNRHEQGLPPADIDVVDPTPLEGEGEGSEKAPVKA